jgi:phosphoribosylaminoimidazole-succinocarboxamide synthase
MSPAPSAAIPDAVFETDLPLAGRRRGKVRDVYALPTPAGDAPRILVVASDRVSAFDVVMPTPIPGKGRLLTQVSVGWFRFLRTLGLVADHMLGTDVDAVPGLDAAQRGALAGRSMTCRAARVVQVECVARGYLAGSGWQEYQAAGTACGIPLPAGLRQCDRLPEPIFTPATKAASGHDENVSFEVMAGSVGAELAATLRDKSLDVFRRGAEYAASRGIVVADTKFEWGHAADGTLLLVDEVLTPDSSRFWPAAGITPGRVPDSFDKQFVRDWLESSGWDKASPPPALPAAVVEKTRQKYLEACRLLTGRGLESHA